MAADGPGDDVLGLLATSGGAARPFISQVGVMLGIVPAALLTKGPPDDAVAQLLIERDGVSPELAAHAARAAQGHVGRARGLARSEDARIRRHEVLSIPAKLSSVADCLIAAENLVANATADADEICASLDEKEMAALKDSLGVGGRGTRKPRHAQSAIRELEEEHKTRRKRIIRDSLDRVLTEFTTFYRDVLTVQTGAGVPLINADVADLVQQVARRGQAAGTVQILDHILTTRTRLEGSVTPQLALEALLVSVLAR